MFLPLTQIIPFPIPLILIATGPVPSGVANLVCIIKINIIILLAKYNSSLIQHVSFLITLYQVRARGVGLTWFHLAFNAPSSVKTFMSSPLRPTCKLNSNCHCHLFNGMDVIYWIVIVILLTLWLQPLVVTSILPVLRPRMATFLGPAYLCSM